MREDWWDRNDDELAQLETAARRLRRIVIIAAAVAICLIIATKALPNIAATVLDARDQVSPW